MNSLTETVNFIKTNYPQKLVKQNDFDIDAQKHISIERPQYLFRGENEIWMETRSTFGRKQISRKDIFPEINQWISGDHLQLGIQVNQNSLYYFLREVIWRIPCITPSRESYTIDQSIAGLLQHYGFDTSFIDLTSDIHVAAFFGSYGATPGGTGQIMILPTKHLEGSVFDLSREEANRPKRQSAYALLAPEQFNLKAIEFQKDSGLKWIRYEISKDDIDRYHLPELLSLENDQVACHIVEWYEAHIRSNNTVSDEVKSYFQAKADRLKNV